MKKAGLFLFVVLLIVGGLCWPSFQNPCPWGRSIAVSRSQDQMALAGVAADDENSDIRQAAAAKVTEPGALAKVALEAKDADIRLNATGKIVDQEVLARVATKDASVEVRKAALGRLTVQSVLAEVALEAKDADIRLNATGKIVDQEVLARVATKDASVEVRKAALGRLTVQSVLAEVAANDTDAAVRQAAVGSLHLSQQADPVLLDRLSKVAGNEKVRAAASAGIPAARQAQFDQRMAKYDNAGALAQAAISSTDPVIRHAAVARLSDQALLAKVAAEANDFGVCRAAAAKVSDAALSRALLDRLSAVGSQIGQEMSVDLGNVSAIALLWIPPTSPSGFTMGSPATEQNRSNDETQHTVILTKGFWLGKTVVTQAQWEAVMGSNPSNFKGIDLPVEQVSWDDAMQFCRKLTDRERQAGRLPEGYEYTLPSEAQWEYACRAGATGAYAGDLDAMAWYSNNSGGTTHPVGTKQSNAWGLYDMHGNVWEWCRDWYGDYPSYNVTDPTGPSSGSIRVLRGGCWSFDAAHCRSAGRSGCRPGIRVSILGFRLALAPQVSR